MSCQQVSRFITANATTTTTAAAAAAALAATTIAVTARTTTNTRLAAEDQDPYVFTESVPTTPPILFNAQKSRARHVEHALTNTIAVPVTAATPTTTTTAQNQTFVQYVSATTTTNAAAATLATSCNNKHAHPIRKQLTSAHKRTTIRAVNVPQTIPLTPTTPTATICALQQPEVTPSLWQTPLLLDTNNTQATESPQTTTTALKSPLHTPIVSLPSPPAQLATTATPLPPSNFHHTTLAQHLQKVECIKKPKKLHALETAQSKAFITPPATPPALAPLQVHETTTTTTAATTNSEQPHSDADLNEIPVNVIFRKPKQAANDICTAVEQPLQSVASVPAALQPQTTLNSQTSSIVSQPPQQLAITDTTTPAHKALVVAKRAKHSRNNKSKLVQHMHHNNNNKHQHAVAIVKMSAEEVGADTTLFACNSVLPYCVQQYWLSASMPHMQSTSSGGCMGREERIAQHRNLLRRQALQLLNTHTLQHLPLHAARKRLLCVDRLLRKYDDHSGKEEDTHK